MGRSSSKIVGVSSPPYHSRVVSAGTTAKYASLVTIGSRNWRAIAAIQMSCPESSYPRAKYDRRDIESRCRLQPFGDPSVVSEMRHHHVRI